MINFSQSSVPKNKELVKNIYLDLSNSGKAITGAGYLNFDRIELSTYLLT